jgi:type II secretory pathway pseudopilin PulG
MNLQRRNRRAFANAFTIIELLMVVAIIIALAAISIGGFRYATTSANRSATSARLAFISTSLESYALDFGEYPQVLRNQTATVEIRDAEFKYGSSVALYQAISGDGNDHIVANGTASDGEFTAEEAQRGITELNPSAYREFDDNLFGMIDGFGQPFLYVRFNRADPTATRNPTFDLWSVADSGTDGDTNDAATEDHPSWIKNW